MYMTYSLSIETLIGRLHRICLCLCLRRQLCEDIRQLGQHAYSLGRCNQCQVANVHRQVCLRHRISCFRILSVFHSGLFGYSSLISKYKIMQALCKLPALKYEANQAILSQHSLLLPRQGSIKASSVSL